MKAFEIELFMFLLSRTKLLSDVASSKNLGLGIVSTSSSTEMWVRKDKFLVLFIKNYRRSINLPSCWQILGLFWTRPVTVFVFRIIVWPMSQNYFVSTILSVHNTVIIFLLEKALTFQFRARLIAISDFFRKFINYLKFILQTFQLYCIP